MGRGGQHVSGGSGISLEGNRNCRDYPLNLETGGVDKGHIPKDKFCILGEGSEQQTGIYSKMSSSVLLTMIEGNKSSARRYFSELL